MNVYDAAEKNGQVEEFHRQVLELAQAQNKATNGGISIPATFLRLTVCVYPLIAYRCRRPRRPSNLFEEIEPVARFIRSGDMP
ncbi:MAG: class SAM-dependent methyltransferase [Massilia sp.]|jgi:hypothetical protein|nr:class SAM-dependent methyltransferase [Massilia sp.]